MNDKANDMPTTALIMRAHRISISIGSGMTDREARVDLNFRVAELCGLIAAGDTARILDLGIVLGNAGASPAPIPCVS